VSAVSPASVYDVVGAMATATPLRSTSYPARPMLSVDAFQLSVTELDVTAVLLNPVGTIGASVSPVESVVPHLTAPLAEQPQARRVGRRQGC
jgi:hypothetical protein